MKKHFAILSLTGLLFASASVFGQNTNKVVILEEVNGVKTLTITTTENGKKNTTTLTGAKAEVEIKKMENQGAGIDRTEFVADDGRLLVRITQKKVNTSTK